MDYHRGRLIDHVHLVVANFERSRPFYAAALRVLGVPITKEGADFLAADELFVSTTGHALGMVTGRHHLAFQAASREQVQAFHSACVAAGGVDNGPPGERPYHPGYYAAFVCDPDGNNIEAVFHGPAERSAPSVVMRTK